MSPQVPRVLFLTKYDPQGASSRYRVFQYIPLFESNGIKCHVSPLFDAAYLTHRYETGSGSAKDLFRAFFRRFVALSRIFRFDLVVVEYETLPYLPALMERWLVWCGVPYIVDFDDAIFHRYDLHQKGWVRRILGNKIAHVMRDAQLVTVGNQYLLNYARGAGARWVEFVPTVVDLNRYAEPRKQLSTKMPLTIGWIGSPSTARYLLAVAPALAELCAQGRVRLRLIGSGPILLPGVMFDVLPWSEATEIEELSRFDIGIMPLPDEPWERGKCGFKLIQYMACGLPVVASPVGVNSEIVEEGVNGYLASSNVEWIQSLNRLIADSELRTRLGKNGRKKIEEIYSLQIVGPKLVELIITVIRNKGVTHRNI